MKVLHCRVVSTAIQQTRTYANNLNLCYPMKKPRHLICFKQWTSGMVREILRSAINLKLLYPHTRGMFLPILTGGKVMVLMEKNQPVLHMAVSKAATLLGAHDVCILDKVVWEHDYMGKIFSKMADIIFVSTTTHYCIERFAKQSTVPVMCMQSRTHASIMALATIMTIIEEFGHIKGLTVGYLGPPHPVLNSYLLLCPMLDANIKFKCGCDKVEVSPLLYKASEEISEEHHTKMVACKTKEELFEDTNIIIAGPTANKREKIKYYKITLKELPKVVKWTFIHCCPRGEEVEDDLFNHDFARTFNMFRNMQYISAALMANSAVGHNFGPIFPGPGTPQYSI
ncbi:aspartate/ornithine carbamoyltransferase, asp/Orn binding domain-containing protein [Phthorimaea operculella]|nr:aspartate/ornithine carbamoyltransferase, asp/Orn binding domain-containing protein [Phthorimaea operculella]